MSVAIDGTLDPLVTNTPEAAAFVVKRFVPLKYTKPLVVANDDVLVPPLAIAKAVFKLKELRYEVEFTPKVPVITTVAFVLD